MASLLWSVSTVFLSTLHTLHTLNDLDFIYPQHFKNKDFGVKLDSNSYAFLTN